VGVRERAEERTRRQELPRIRPTLRLPELCTSIPPFEYLSRSQQNCQSNRSSTTREDNRSSHLNSLRLHPCLTHHANMQILSTWVLLASAALGAVAAEDLKIDVTVPVECDRKTQSGDKVQMHYRGTLAADGKQFDASMSCPASPPRLPSCRRACALGSTGSLRPHH